MTPEYDPIVPGLRAKITPVDFSDDELDAIYQALSDEIFAHAHKRSGGARSIALGSVCQAAGMTIAHHVAEANGHAGKPIAEDRISAVLVNMIQAVLNDVSVGIYKYGRREGLS